MSMTRGRLPDLLTYLLLIIVSPALAQVEGKVSPVLQLDQAVLIALEQNPELASLKAQSDAMHTMPSQAGAGTTGSRWRPLGRSMLRPYIDGHEGDRRAADSRRTPCPLPPMRDSQSDRPS